MYVQCRCVCGEKPKFIIKLVKKTEDFCLLSTNETKVIFATDTKKFLFNERFNWPHNETINREINLVATTLINK